MTATATTLKDFFRVRAPKSESSIRLEGPRVDDFTALERLRNRAESMANAADKSGQFDDVPIAEIIDAANEYLTKE